MDGAKRDRLSRRFCRLEQASMQSALSLILRALLRAVSSASFQLERVADLPTGRKRMEGSFAFSRRFLPKADMLTNGGVRYSVGCAIRKTLPALVPDDDVLSMRLTRRINRRIACAGRRLGTQRRPRDASGTNWASPDLGHSAGSYAAYCGPAGSGRCPNPLTAGRNQAEGMARLRVGGRYSGDAPCGRNGLSGRNREEPARPAPSFPRRWYGGARWRAWLLGCATARPRLKQTQMTL